MEEKILTIKECPMGLMERMVSLHDYYIFTENRVKNPNLDLSKYTMDELVIILELINQNGLYQNEIAKRIHKNKSTVKRSLDKLSKKNVIIKVRDKEDTRKFNIYLREDKVAEFREKFILCGKEDRAWYTERLGEEGYKNFVQTLLFLYEESRKYFED